MKKGFTLIELLAVIIILAIIALIATPIILNVIDDAKKSAGLSEANMIYSGIENYCSVEEMKEQMDSSYVRICNNQMTAEEVSKMVNLGNAEIIELSYGSRLNRLKIKSNGYIYTLVDGKITEGDIAITETYEVGELLRVNVGNNIMQDIYVLEVNGTEVTGILNRNLGSNVAWASNEDLQELDIPDNITTEEEAFDYLKETGPITANKALEERTSEWSNVIDKRIPSAEELIKLTEFYQNLSDKSNWEIEYLNRLTEFFDLGLSCTSMQECREVMIQAGFDDILLPEWLVTNLYSTGNSTTHGYWTGTLANHEDFDFGFAWGVVYSKVLDIFDFLDSTSMGIRPIITIDVSNIDTSLFVEDSWETIAEMVRSGKAEERYKVGDIKEVTVEGYSNGDDQTFTVRIANMSTPEECSSEGFSQTACGFVVEFVDIITENTMHSSTTSVSWPDTNMYSFVTEDIYNALPSDLRNVIIDTYTVSHYSETWKSVSTDKLYLLSPKEVWGDDLLSDYTATLTRQLDYYNTNNVTTENYSGAIKTYQGSENSWWLRSEYWVSCDRGFFTVMPDGDYNHYYYTYTEGIAPAFRIG